MKKIALFFIVILTNLSFLFALQPIKPSNYFSTYQHISPVREKNSTIPIPIGPIDGINMIQKQNSAEAITIAPNPATDHIDIQLNSDNSSLKEILLFDITGKLIKSISDTGLSLEKNKLTMSRDNLAGGVYFLVIKTTAEEHCRKIIFS